MKFLMMFMALLVSQTVFSQGPSASKQVTEDESVPKEAVKKPMTKSLKAKAKKLANNTQKLTSKLQTPPPPQAEERKWYVRLISENAKNMTTDNGAGYNGDIAGFQLAAFGYHFSKELSGQLSQEWTHFYGYGTGSDGIANDADTTMEDLSVRLTQVNVLSSNGLAWAVQGRYYAPTSEVSQLQRQVGQLRLYFIGEAEITKKLSATLLVSPRYYLQRDKTYVDTYGIVGGAGTEGKTLNNNHYRLLNSAGLKYSLIDELALETTVGVFSKKKFNQQTQHFQDYSTSVYYTPNSVFTFNVGIRASDSGLDVRKNDFELYNHRVSEYFGIVTINLK